MSNPIMWDDRTLSLYLENKAGVFTVDLSSVTIGPMRKVESIPETAKRWEPLMTMPRILCANAVTAAVRRAESAAMSADLRTTAPKPWGDGQ